MENFTLNHSLSTDSFEYSPTQASMSKIGGSSQNKNVPNGGFPPIYLCDELIEDSKINKDDENKKREYETHKTSVSIKSILEKRRDITPFIET
jgi:hypothetical protein